MFLHRGFTWGLLLYAIAGFVSAHAEQSADRPLPSVPDVRNLPANWWGFASSVPPEERATALKMLSTVARDAGATAEDVAEIATLSSAYAAIIKVASPTAAPAAAVHETYTFDEVLDLQNRRKEIELELRLTREQAQRKARLLPQSEKQLSSRKADYLALPVNDPKRLDGGVRIIIDRLRLAIETEQLRLEQAQVVSWEAMLGHIDDEISVAMDRLKIEPAMIEDARAKAEKFRKRAEKAHREVTAVDSTQYASSDADPSQSIALRTSSLIAAEARVLENESAATRYALQADFLAARLGRTDADFDRLYKNRLDSDEFVQNASATNEVWQEAATRERARALKLISNDQTEGHGRGDPLAEKRIAVANEIARTSAQIESSLSRIVFIEQQASAFLASETGRVRDWLVRAGNFAQTSWTNVRSWASSSLFEINDTPVTLIGLLRIAIILIIAAWISKFVRMGLHGLATRNSGMNRSSLYMLGRIFHYVIFAAAFLIALSSIGLDFTKLAIVAGALGVGIGFGLQAIFSNFISGIIVLFERSLKVGDFVELESGVTGEVREINIRSTLITTNDNIDILVPNSEFVNGRVINWTLRDAHRRTRIPFGVAYGTDKDLVKKAVLEAAADVAFTLKNYPGREAQVWLVEFGDSSLNFELVVWLTREAVVRPASVHAAYTWAIDTALRKYDIEIPFPQRDINIRSFFGRKDEVGLKWFDEARKTGD